MCEYFFHLVKIHYLYGKSAIWAAENSVSQHLFKKGFEKFVDDLVCLLVGLV